MSNNNILVGILSSAVAVLLYMICFSYFARGGGEPGDSVSMHRPAQSLSAEAPSDDDRFLMLRQSIDELAVVQQQLIVRNDGLQQRIADLESELLQRPGTPAGTGYLQLDKQMAIDPDLEELDMADESGALSKFDELQNQMLFENYDSVWSSEMEASFTDIEQRLQGFNMHSTMITHKECRSQSCFVEFTHLGEVDRAQLAGLLAANGAREVMLKPVQEGGVEKTLAIYRR